MPFCNKCEFSNKDRYIKPEGSKKSKIVFVGESPGVTELFSGSPFTGYAGGLLNWFLRNSGILKKTISRDSIYITNALKCFPSNSSQSDFFTLESQKIKKHHVLTCRSKLKKELELIKPKIIITLGSVALQSVFNDFSLNVTKRTGFFYYNEEFDCYVRPLIHPAAILRNWSYTDQTIICMNQIKKAIDSGVPTYKLPKYLYIKDIKMARKLFNILSNSDFISFDTETSSLNYWDKNEDILGFSFSWGFGKAAWIPLFNTGKDGRTKYWPHLQELQILKMIKSVLENKSIKKVGQNIKFDINWCERYGIIVRNVVWDTYQIHHLINENTPNTLTYLTSYYDLNFPPYEFTLTDYITATNPKYEFIPSSILGNYAAADADATYRIALKQIKILPERKKRIYDKISVEISKFAREMEWNGTLIDVPAISSQEKEYEKNIKNETSDLAKLVKMDQINVASPKQLQALLFEKLGLKSKKKTKTGALSTDADVFDSLLKHYSNKVKITKILKLIQEIKSMRKMKSTYLTGLRKLVDSKDRLHTNCLTAKIVTGRLATKNPSLQTCPKNPIFRSLFIAGLGRKLIISDYRQIEAKLLAFVAGEKILIEKFKDPDFDIHSFNASSVLKIPLEDVTDEQRRNAKSVTFGINYGRSPESIAEEYDLDIDEVVDFIEGYFNTYKYIARFRDYQKVLAKKNLKLSNAIGRNRTFSGFRWVNSPEMKEVSKLREDFGLNTYTPKMIELGMERQALNFPIQSYAHDILARAVGRIRKEIKRQSFDMKTYLIVHDEVVFNSAEKDAERGLKIVEKLMPITKTSESGLSITFTVDAHIANNWAE